MTTLGGITRYSCPLPDCGWQRDVTPADGKWAVELAMREHCDEHSTLQYVRALTAAQADGDRLAAEVERQIDMKAGVAGRWANALADKTAAHAAIDRVRALHVFNEDADYCNVCADGGDIRWPCATIAALDGQRGSIVTADAGDDVVTELTVAEFHEAARAALASLGVTYAGLAEQARLGDFESARANMLWKTLSGALPDGFV